MRVPAGPPNDLRRMCSEGHVIVLTVVESDLDSDGCDSSFLP